VHLVTRVKFRSRDKDGSHTIRSAIAENPVLHANCMALCFTELELLPIEVLRCGNKDFRPFCFRDLDLDPMTFIHEPDPYSLEIYAIANMNFLRQGFRQLLSDRQTRLKLYTTPLRGWSVIITTSTRVIYASFRPF